MTARLLKVCLGILAGCFFITSLAQTGGDSGQGTTGTTGGATGLTSERTSLSAIRLAIQNGLIRTINQTRQATINLQFEPLPMSQALTDQATAFGVKPVVIEVPNSALSSAQDWTHSLSQDQKNSLFEALYLNPSDFTWGDGDARDKIVTKARQGFSDRFGDNPVQPWPSRPNLLASISPGDLLSSTRDLNYFLFLLQSTGMSASFSVPDADVRGQNPRMFDQEITWEIKIFRFLVYKKGNDPAVHSDELCRYRIAVVAKVHPFLCNSPTLHRPRRRFAPGFPSSG